MIKLLLLATAGLILLTSFSIEIHVKAKLLEIPTIKDSCNEENIFGEVLKFKRIDIESQDELLVLIYCPLNYEKEFWHKDSLYSFVYNSSYIPKEKRAGITNKYRGSNQSVVESFYIEKLRTKFRNK